MTTASRPAFHPVRDIARRGWWIAPLIVTLITLPLLAYDGLLALLSPMAYDPCDSGGCPQTGQHIVLAVACLPVALLLWIGSWPAARSAGPALRSTLYLLAPAAALLSLVSFCTIPIGR
ncbi:hypothetical protein E6W39_19615 [Kitasatospora acidiphila]|uniref:Transmembrane protein n=1 Tax=Kitasatospora acidiphila TaxID=2567942 RepID=A0A540W4X8_9ACTN|nr:hypothetical protein [Kitasatospora acidiphila]TQF04033.1 hypothetical protein E6W39_19615 [Kitasatospora acidiphila]